ncbi:hypothetical protein Pcinc_010084 [Petrolisthes cinctipes]|uniref:Uncharacterized protein n=1 Tax=Petrolisthes cinctipes TaxID=88211 RepID=A0AAE1KU00_PETCI|nr:hypothetical protein Pcinc_010084 [Petrolisthes cinctipes]
MWRKERISEQERKTIIMEGGVAAGETRRLRDPEENRREENWKRRRVLARLWVTTSKLSPWQPTAGKGHSEAET